MEISTLFKLFGENNPRPFTNDDWMAFAGCEGETPMVAYLADGSAIILDVRPGEIVLEMIKPDGLTPEVISYSNGVRVL